MLNITITQRGHWRQTIKNSRPVIMLMLNRCTAMYRTRLIFQHQPCILNQVTNNGTLNVAKKETFEANGLVAAAGDGGGCI